MNSLVWVSSTSVHSLLRKAGTFELCFIVNETQGFQILHPNTAAAVARRWRRRRRQLLLRENAHNAGAAALGPRPPPSLAKRAARRGGPAAAHDGQVSAFGPCALVPRWSCFRPIPGADCTTKKSDRMLPTRRGWEQRGRCLLIRLLCSSRHCSGPQA